MAYDLNVGGGRTVTVNEPLRSNFADNLGGAVEFSLVHFVYKVFEVMGGALGSFGGGVAVQFLEVLEPELLEYIDPILDELDRLPELPDFLRSYIAKLRETPHPAGALLTGAVGTSAISAATYGVMGALLSPVTYGINHLLHPFRPDPLTLLAYKWREKLPEGTFADYLEDQGYADFMFNNAEAVLRPRLAEGGLAEALRRGKLPVEDVLHELIRRGYPALDSALFAVLTDTLLPLGDLIKAWRRETIDDIQVERGIEAHGFSPIDTQTLLSNSMIIPPVADLVTMAVREAWDDKVATDWGYDKDRSAHFDHWAKMQGLDPDWALRYWRSHWRLPSVTLGYEMFQRRIISPDQLSTLLRISDYPEGWRDYMIRAAYKVITRVDVRRFYRIGMIDHAGLIERYRDVGYSPEDAETMAIFTELYEAPDGTDKLEAARELTRSFIMAAYVKGLITKAEAETRLETIGYSVADVDLAIRMADIQRELDEVPDYLKEYRKDVEKLVIRSYTKRLIGGDKARSMLADIGLCDLEIELQLAVADFQYLEMVRDKELDIIGQAYVRRAIDRQGALGQLGSLALPSTQQRQILAEWDLERNLRTRRLTEASYRHAVKIGSMAIAQYQENLRGLGYPNADIATLTDGLIEGFTRSELRRLIAKATLTESAYRGTMGRLGFTDAEINTRLKA